MYQIPRLLPPIILIRRGALLGFGLGTIYVSLYGFFIYKLALLGDPDIQIAILIYNIASGSLFGACNGSIIALLIARQDYPTSDFTVKGYVDYVNSFGATIFSLLIILIFILQQQPQHDIITSLTMLCIPYFFYKPLNTWLSIKLNHWWKRRKAKLNQ